LHALLDQEKRDIASTLAEISYERGDVVITQGEIGNILFFMIEGEVEFSKDGKVLNVIKASADSDKCVYFGERALMRNERRAATVKVVSDSARMLFMDKPSYDALLEPFGVLKTYTGGFGGPAPVISKEGTSTPVKTTKDADVKADVGLGVTESHAFERGTIRFADIQKVSLIGAGGFGAVWLCQHQKTGHTFALKAQSKGHVVKTGMRTFVISERDMYFSCNSDFVVRLYETFSDAQNLYLLMEAVIGGELFTTYAKHGFSGSEKHARFYASAVVLALAHMHERHIIYRDLKPENLLLSDQGYLKVADMGLAKVCKGKTFTTCGTPEYFAPEMVQSSGHTVAVDWWALGILVYELMAGKTPFESDSQMQTCKKIVQGIAVANMPKVCQSHVGSFIKGMLEKCPNSRLPMKAGGIGNVKRHPWYSNFDWDAFTRQTMIAPYVPNVKHKTDSSNFTCGVHELPPVIDYKDDGSGWDKGFATSY